MTGLSVGWGELNLQLRRAKSFSLWRELGCTVCTCLRKNLTCLRHLFMDLGNDQIWKGNLIYQQVSQNLMQPTATPCAAQKVHRDPRAAVSLPPRLWLHLLPLPPCLSLLSLTQALPSAATKKMSSKPSLHWCSGRLR